MSWPRDGRLDATADLDKRMVIHIMLMSTVNMMMVAMLVLPTMKKRVFGDDDEDDENDP